MRRQQLLLLIAWTLLLLLLVVSSMLYQTMKTLSECGHQEQQMNKQLVGAFNDFLALKLQSANMRIEFEALKETVALLHEK